MQKKIPASKPDEVLEQYKESETPRTTLSRISCTLLRESAALMATIPDRPQDSSIPDDIYKIGDKVYYFKAGGIAILLTLHITVQVLTW